MPTTPTLATTWSNIQLHYIAAPSVFFGKAEPGITVQLWNGGTLLSTVTANADGSWSTPGLPLTDGSYHVSAVSIDAASNKSTPTGVLDFLVDRTAPTAPTIVLEQPGGADVLMAVFSGTAEANATVELNLGQAGNTTTVVNAQGHWGMGTLLADGHIVVTAAVRDAAGNLSPATTLSFDRITPDDFGNDAAHATALPVGSTVGGSINYVGDRDWFKLSLSELTTYTISLKGAHTGGGTLPWVVNASAADLTLWDPQANGGAGELTFLSGGATAAADLLATLPVMHSGDYYLSLGALNQVGTYTLGVAMFSHDDYYNDEARAATVPAGGTIAGRFDYSGDVDVFKVRLTAGTTYEFDLAHGTGLDDFANLYLGVTDAAHSIWVGRNFNDQYHAIAGFAPAVTGDYFVSAGYGGTIPGGYQLSMKALSADDFGASPASSGALAIGASVQGTIEVGGDRDWFAVSLQAGTAYSFQLDQGSQGDWSSLYLHDASGAQLPLNTTQYIQGKLLDWTPAASGTYFLDVGNSHGTAAYTLQARLANNDDHGASAASAGVIFVGQGTSGRLEMPGDIDWYKVSMKANTAYTFQVQPVKEGMSGVPLSADLSIVGGAGQVQANGSSNGVMTTVTWQAPSDGDYYVAVSAAHNEIFSYSISSTVNEQDRYPANAGTTGTLSPGGAVQSSVDFSGDTDWFKIELQAGQQYTFELTGVMRNGGTLGSPELQLYNSNQAFLWNVDGIGYADPSATFTPTTTGTYYLQAGANPRGTWDLGVTGTYTLKAGSASTPITNTPPVALSLTAPESAGTNPQTDLLYVKFSEPIALGSGVVTLRLASGELVEQFDVATSGRLSVYPDFLLRIDPTAPLAYGTAYRLELSATAVKDNGGLTLAAPFSASFVTVAQNVPVPQGLVEVGGPGNDVYLNTGSSDWIDGGAGLDTVIYKGDSSSYSIHVTGQTAQVVSGPALDSLLNVERVVFDDRAIAFDLGSTAGQAYRLYRASFDRVPDAAGLGYWIVQMDKGATLHEVAQGFLGSAEFKSLFGAAPSDTDFVKALYGNVLHRSPDQAGLDYWINVLQHGGDHAGVLVEFSTSAENQAAVIGQISQGISFLPYH